MADGRDADAIRAAIEGGHSFDAEESPRPGVALPARPTPGAAGTAGTTGRAVRPAAEPEEFTPSERRRAFAIAAAAWESRDEADEFFLTLAPTWPPSRQPVIDRSILRLAWHEMRAGKTPPRIVVSEAIDMARDFSTEKSPAFINGLLDKALKRFEGQGFDAGDTDDQEEADQEQPE
jgi:N utilization substance protein B